MHLYNTFSNKPIDAKRSKARVSGIPREGVKELHARDWELTIYIEIFTTREDYWDNIVGISK